MTFSTGAPPACYSSPAPPNAFPHPMSTLSSVLATILDLTYPITPSWVRVILYESERTSVPVVKSMKSLILLQQCVIIISI